MHKFTIELSEEEVKKVGEYIAFMNEDEDNNIKTIESAIGALAMVRLDERLEQLRK